MIHDVDISVLIPTHNRPMLFERAIQSVFDTNTNLKLEIVVNNDTHDIHEITGSVPVTYMYTQHEDLSKIYERLIDKATGRMVCFLEDDDYMLPNYFDNIAHDDVYYIEYLSNPLVQEIGITQHMKRMNVNRSAMKCDTLSQFVETGDFRDFQLGQIIFNPDLITHFPSGNNIENDYELLRNIANNAKTFKYLTGARWVQTTDGNDNISFDNLNTDERFN